MHESGFGICNLNQVGWTLWVGVVGLGWVELGMSGTGVEDR